MVGRRMAVVVVRAFCFLWNRCLLYCWSRDSFQLQRLGECAGAGGIVAGRAARWKGSARK